MDVQHSLPSPFSPTALYESFIHYTFPVLTGALWSSRKSPPQVPWRQNSSIVQKWIMINSKTVNIGCPQDSPLIKANFWAKTMERLWCQSLWAKPMVSKLELWIKLFLFTIQALTPNCELNFSYSQFKLWHRIPRQQLSPGWSTFLVS